jgi:hypothetical protein
MRRRTLLALVGAGTASLAGCSTTDRDGTGGEPTPGTDTPEADESTPLPEECPTSQDIDVEWPTDVDPGAVESFVEDYERVYYREEVVEYEPQSRLDSYELAGSVSGPPNKSGDGWVVAYSGSGGIYRPTLAMDATVTEPPEGVEPVPVGEIDDEPLTAMLEDAAETGEAELYVEPPGEKVEQYLDLLASLSGEFDGLSGRGDSDSLHVDVDGTTVELSVTATNFHGDYWWDAWYYVDEHVVRRTSDEEADPRDGELLECRHLD